MLLCLRNKILTLMANGRNVYGHIGGLCHSPFMTKCTFRPYYCWFCCMRHPDTSISGSFFGLQRISPMAVGTSLEKQLDRMGPTASRGVSRPVFLTIHKATCDFPGGSGPHPLLSGSAHVLFPDTNRFLYSYLEHRFLYTHVKFHVILLCSLYIIINMKCG